MPLDDIALLEGLLRHYSPSGQEAQAVTYLCQQMQALGYTAGADEAGNAIGTLGAGPNEIILLGHIDTVPGEIPIHYEAGQLWGRGSVDAKGPLACFVLAGARAVRRPGWRITVIGAVGEEGDARGAHFLCHHRPAPTYTIIGEPSSWERVTLGYKGSVWLRYQVERSLAHSAASNETACEAAVSFWNSLYAGVNAYNQTQPRLFYQFNVGLRKMHSQQDGFMQRAELEINLRLPPGVASGDVPALARRYAPQADGEIEILDSVDCYLAEKNSAPVRAFLAAIRAQGGRPGFVLKTGTSDMNLVGPAWGCPILAYGPGDSNLDHTPDEHIDLQEYQRGIAVLTAALEKLMDEAG